MQYKRVVAPVVETAFSRAPFLVGGRVVTYVESAMFMLIEANPARYRTAVVG